MSAPGRDAETAARHGHHDMTIKVINANDTPTAIDGGATHEVEVQENHLAVYTPRLARSDRAVTSTVWTLSGPDADLFTIDPQSGAIRFRQDAGLRGAARRGQGQSL